jgi:hypothetical protein
MSWSLNKTKSLENFLTVFRKHRESKFKQLDIEFMRALETYDTNTQHSITLQKNTLRNFPSTITLDSFSTLDELKSQWPTSSLDTPPNW